MEQGKIELITGTRHEKVPSHILYADDIMLFCKGKVSCITALINVFTRYAHASGQIISTSKSTLCSGGIQNARLLQIVNLIGFNIDTTPFNYLGVPIFKGKPKARFLQQIADKVKAKLSAWKASLLTIAGRTQLFKSVVQSMLIHAMSMIGLFIC